jgi:predicted patatin/cPLA2 family phospholipase
MVYFSNENINFNVLKASKAMPIVYGKKVYINNDAYADKPYSPYKIIVDQKKNLERKILLVDVSENGFLIRNLFKMLDSKNKEGSLQEMFIIKPDNLKTSILSRSKKVLEKSFDEGYQYAISREATIREYLNN